ncbi:MAG: cupredoxin domain-containing protein, partial [Candidatus Limnocylindria bacterium]
MRTRFLIPVLLIGLVACSSPAATDTPGSVTPSSDAASDAISVSVADFMINSAELETSGPTVSFEVTNDGPTPHNFSVRDAADEVLMATADLSAGDSETITGELAPGEYTIFCSLPG